MCHPFQYKSVVLNLNLYWPVDHLSNMSHGRRGSLCYADTSGWEHCGPLEIPGGSPGKR